MVQRSRREKAHRTLVNALPKNSCHDLEIAAPEQCALCMKIASQAGGGLVLPPRSRRGHPPPKQCPETVALLQFSAQSLRCVEKFCPKIQPKMPFQALSAEKFFWTKMPQIQPNSLYDFWKFPAITHTFFKKKRPKPCRWSFFYHFRPRRQIFLSPIFHPIFFSTNFLRLFIKTGALNRLPFCLQLTGVLASSGSGQRCYYEPWIKNTTAAPLSPFFSPLVDSFA